MIKCQIKQDYVEEDQWGEKLSSRLQKLFIQRHIIINVLNGAIFHTYHFSFKNWKKFYSSVIAIIRLFWCYNYLIVFWNQDFSLLDLKKFYRLLNSKRSGQWWNDPDKWGCNIVGEREATSIHSWHPPRPCETNTEGT